MLGGCSGSSPYNIEGSMLRNGDKKREVVGTAKSKPVSGKSFAGVLAEAVEKEKLGK